MGLLRPAGALTLQPVLRKTKDIMSASNRELSPVAVTCLSDWEPSQMTL